MISRLKGALPCYEMRLRRKPLALSFVVVVIVCAMIAVEVADSRMPEAPMLTPAEAPARDVAIVLGCGPGTLLTQRMDAACALVSSQKAHRLVLSGFGLEIPYMRKRAQECGLQEDAILVDDGAVRTLENLRRARDKFGVTSALVVTQRYHLGRALYLANALGIDAVGVVAPGVPADKMQLVRERFARVKAIVDVALL